MIRPGKERIERLLLGQERLLQEIHGLLESEQKHDDILRAVVLSSRRHRINRIPRLDPDRVFHVDAIRDICVKYRLRFLDGALFKGEIPLQAIYAIRQLEARAEAPLQGFKLLAPASRFRLCDSDADPLLFIPVGKEHYYLVHQWGKDMAPWRALLAWPFRSVVHLAATVGLLAVLLTLLVPNAMITSDPLAGTWGPHRMFFLFWSSMVLSSFTVFAWFAFFGSFSKDDWNSRHFN